MTDITERLRSKENPALLVTYEEAADTIERLRAELAACKEDAERYRWLRDMDHWPAAFDGHEAPEPLRGTELDDAIDAARREA